MPESHPRATCPNCQARIRIHRPELVGTRIKCPGCSKPFRIELSDVPQRSAQETPPAEDSPPGVKTLRGSNASESIRDEADDASHDDLEEVSNQDDWESAVSDATDILEEEDDFENEETTRRRRREKKTANARPAQVAPPGNLTGHMIAMATAACVLLTYLVSIAWPASHPQITRYGTLPADEQPSSYEGPHGETDGSLGLLIANQLFSGPESELLNVLDEVIQQKCALPKGAQDILAKRAMEDSRPEVLLRAVSLAFRQGIDRQKFLTSALVHSDERVVQAAIQALRGKVDRFSAELLLTAYEDVTTRGRDGSQARDALLGLPDELWQASAGHAKTAPGFKIFADHGGVVALQRLLFQRWEAKPPVESAAIDSAIDAIWKRILQKIGEGEVRFDRGDLYLGAAGKGLAPAQLLRLDVPPELRDRLVQALRSWPRTWESTGAPSMDAYIQLSAKLDTRSLDDVVTGLAVDKGVIPKNIFRQLSYVKHQPFNDALMAALAKKQWPSYPAVEFDYRRIAAQAMKSPNQKFVATAAEILSGRLSVDGRPTSGRSLSRDDVAALIEVASGGEQAGILVDSILRSANQLEPTRPIGFLQSPRDVQKATVLDQAWRGPDRVPQPQMLPFVRALWISPPPLSAMPDLSPKLPSISNKALSALRWVDPASRNDVLTLARGLLGAADLRTRAAAGDLLVVAGEASDVTLMVNCLLDARLRPLVSLSLARWASKDCQLQLLALLKRSNDEATSLEILNILKEIATKEASEGLEKIAVGDSKVAKEATLILKRINNPKFRRTQIGNDSNPFEGALWQLRGEGIDSGGTVDVAKALAALQTNDEVIRSQNLAWLKHADYGPTGHPEAAAVTLKLIDSPNVATACFATVVYAKSAGEAAVPKLIELLKTDAPFRKEAAAEGLAEIDHPAALVPLVELLKHRETRLLGRAALLRVSRRNVESVISAVQPLIDGSDLEMATTIGFVVAEVGRSEDLALLDAAQMQHPHLSTFFAEMRAVLSERTKSK